MQPAPPTNATNLENLATAFYANQSIEHMAGEAINHYKVVLLGEGKDFILCTRLPLNHGTSHVSYSYLFSNCPILRDPSSLGRVGKTSILLRYVDDSYVEGRPSTLQASYLDKHVVIEDGTNNYLSSSSHNRTSTRREAQLSIWDTAGQERFHSLGPIYYRDAKGAVLVYDLTDKPSFDRVKKWTKELRKMVGDTSKICITIVGNKLDLERQGRAVDSKEAEKYATSVGATFLEVSAKTGR